MEESNNEDNKPGCSNSKVKESRLGLCEVCSFSAARYTCPRCEVKTCGLKCNKIHKLELECNGARDKAKFIPLKKMTNFDVSSDYRMLEELTRNVEVYKKTFSQKFYKANRELPHHLYKLKAQAGVHKTNIKFLPFGFVKRKLNTTFVNFKTKIISWHIEWVFTNAENLKVVDTRVPEMQKLCDVLQKHLIKQEDAVLQEKLQYYQACDVTALKAFLKAEGCAGDRFYELDLMESVKDNLRNKIIIEYPTIHIVLKDHAGCFTLVDQDTTNIKTEQSGNDIVNNIIRNAEKDESLYKSLKNLLFISEYSDGEISEEE